MTKNMCRVCLDQELLIDIFKKAGILKISTKLMSLAKVHISPEDSLPKTICTKCVQKLDDCIEFIELCEASDTKLRALLDNNCEDNKLIMDTTDITTENNMFLLDNDTTLSPKSEAEKVLYIDESIDHSVMDQTITADLLKNELKLDIKSVSHSKINKKTQKQQCFTCGKVMSSRQVNQTLY